MEDTYGYLEFAVLMGNDDKALVVFRTFREVWGAAGLDLDPCGQVIDRKSTGAC
jgi:hypothetical protein